MEKLLPVENERKGEIWSENDGNSSAISSRPPELSPDQHNVKSRVLDMYIMQAECI